MFRQRAPRSAAQRLAMAVVAVLTLALGYYLGYRLGGPGAHTPSSPQALVAAGESRDLADLELTDHYGKPFGAEQLADRWSLLAFAHPADTEQVRAALTRLVFVHNRLVDQPALQKAFRGLVVALDPVTDPAQLRELVDIDSADFVGLSGDPDVVAGLVPASARGTAAGWLALVDPQRRLVGWFTPDAPPATIAGDIKALARAPRAD
jgi:cytochrome oxidase Cu insertion factor (SCO1/SenC/PrrC family)